MSHMAFKRFRPDGARSAPAAEAFLGRLETWLDGAGFADVRLAMGVRDHKGDGAPQVVDLDLAPGRPGAASLSVSLCAWPDGEVDYYLSVGADPKILTSTIDDRLDADSVLAICEAVAAGGLHEQRLTLAGRTIGHRAAVRHAHIGVYAQRSGLSGLRLDRVLAALGLARLEDIGYPTWKAI